MQKYNFWDCHQMSELGGQSSFNFWCWTQTLFFAVIYFMGFPAILSILQSFQICIYNRKYSKLTFSNGSQLMGKRFMANLHASVESTCKSKISKISTRCQNWRGGSIIFQLLMLNSEINFCIDIFYGVSCNIKHITHYTHFKSAFTVENIVN